MLTELCAELRNWFVKSDDDKMDGNFTITSGVFAPPIYMADNQFYLIKGSLYNDGVHQQGDMLEDETFTGSVWLMNVPKDVIELSQEIDAYKEKYGAKSPYSSESFGGYSYSKPIGVSGTPLTWRELFKEDLKRYRKI